MGKAGKARKKRKLLAQAVEEDPVDSDDDGESDLDTAICVLNTLSTRLQMYDSKSLKPLRISLYPLIQRQSDKFFEDPAPPRALSELEVIARLAPARITATLRITSMLTQQPSTFSSVEFKDFRRALHPFVLYQHRKSSSVGQEVAAAKATSAHKILPEGWSSATPGSTATNMSKFATNHKKQSMSNRVAYFYRVGDWCGALRALHDLRLSADSPKLGSLQRWVRESDTETFQLSSMKSEASSHVVSGSDQGSTVASADASIIPSYAMGNDFFCVDKLTADELSTRVMSQRLLYAVLHLMQTKLRASVANGKRKLTSMVEDEDGNKGQEELDQCVNCVVKCIACPIFHASAVTATPIPAEQQLASNSTAAPGQVPESSGFAVSNAADALACLQVFQAMFAVSLPVLSPAFMDMVSVVFNIPGPERRPPSAHDLNIYRCLASAFTPSSSLDITEITTGPTTKDATMALASLTEIPSDKRQQIIQLVKQPYFHRSTPPRRHDIPDVPGAFLMTNVLSPLECCQLMTMAETMNYTPDAVFGIDNVIWLGNESLMSLLADRVEPLVPAELNGRKFAGINARLRLFRYYAGAVYRPHIDGAWPGSGMTPEGMFTDDAFGGDRHSQLTFLVYLNDGFDGGATTFFLPSKDGQAAAGGGGGDAAGSDEKVGVIEARGVKPRQGSVLCFPHGNAIGSLVHEGSAVADGVKYVIRSDALYYV